MLIMNKLKIAFLLVLLMPKFGWAVDTTMDSFESVPTTPPASPGASCTEYGEPVIPLEFIDELIEERSRSAAFGNSKTESIKNFPGMGVLHDGIYPEVNDFQQMPDFNQRLKAWRVAHGLPADVDCSIPSPASTHTPMKAEALAGITTTPQHSIAEHILRKQTFTLYLFDSKPDGDTIDIEFNGRIVLFNFVLPSVLNKYPLRLTLQPSKTLSRKTNTLLFRAKSGGIFSDNIATVSTRIDAAEVFTQSLLSQGRVTLKPGETRSINLALGLACVKFAEIS